MKKTIYIIVNFILTFSIYSTTSDELDSLLSATSIVLYESNSNIILYERLANKPFPPASMTKLMTLYLAYEAIEKGDLLKDQVITVTETGSAFSRPDDASVMLLEAGQNVSVKKLMEGVAVASGNDAAYALAELISGNVNSFVIEMNRKCEQLGMYNSYFVDPDGYSADNRVTAYDYLILADSYINRFPEALSELHTITQLEYPLPENIAPNGHIVSSRVKKNTNWLLDEVEGVDGLKSGYIDESGFNFAATAQRGQTRFITVIMGIFTDSFIEGLNQRALESEILLEYAFENFKTLILDSMFNKSIKLFFGEEEQIEYGLSENIYYTVESQSSDSLQIFLDIPAYLEAPISSGDIIGRAQVWHDGKLIDEVDIVSKESSERGSFLHNSVDFFERIFY